MSDPQQNGAAVSNSEEAIRKQEQIIKDELAKNKAERMAILAKLQKEYFIFKRAEAVYKKAAVHWDEVIDKAKEDLGYSPGSAIDLDTLNEIKSK